MDFFSQVYIVQPETFTTFVCLLLPNTLIISTLHYWDLCFFIPQYTRNCRTYCVYKNIYIYISIEVTWPPSWPGGGEPWAPGGVQGVSGPQDRQGHRVQWRGQWCSTSYKWSRGGIEWPRNDQWLWSSDQWLWPHKSNYCLVSITNHNSELIFISSARSSILHSCQ